MPAPKPSPATSAMSPLDENHSDAATPRLALRELGSRAHQLRSALRAADHFATHDGSDGAEIGNTGAWLISASLDLARELAADIDALARSLKEAPADTGLLPTVAALRVRAQQLLAATRAADHFLDQPGAEDRDTGSWLVATARGLATRLAAAFDDSSLPQRRQAGERAPLEVHDPALARRVANATAPLRGAA